MDKIFNVTPITAVEYSTAVFVNLFSVLDKKGLLTCQEIGEALLKDADDPAAGNRQDGSVEYIRALGNALIRRGL